MPQSPIGYNTVNPSGRLVPQQSDANGVVMEGSGRTTALNITAAAVVKAGVGRIATVIVNTAGSAPGKVSDVAAIGDVAAGNLIYNIPNTVGIYKVDFPIVLGLGITPGTGQVLSISYF